MASKPGYTVERDQSGMTRRQREVLGLFAAGETNLTQMASVLDLSRQRTHQLAGELEKKGLLIRYDSGETWVKLPAEEVMVELLRRAVLDGVAEAADGDETYMLKVAG